MKRVAVLMGGWSAERAVSLSSGREVSNALRDLGYDVREIDVAKDAPSLVAALESSRPDVIFNALHGRGGEDGQIQALLDLLAIPYTHSGMLASALAMDKPIAKTLFQAAGLPVVDGRIATPAEIAAGGVMPAPYVVKPRNEGSSVGVTIVYEGDNRPVHVQTEMLVERYIPGRELTVAILGDRALPVIEIVASSRWYDYEAKYAEGGSAHLCPAPIPEPVAEKAGQIALAAHRVLGCRGVSRADFRYDDTETTPGRLYLLEVNTQPGMTPTSLVPDAARAIGMSYADLVAWMVEGRRMRRVKAPRDLRSARLLLARRRLQRYLPRRPVRLLAFLVLGTLVGVGVLAAADSLDRGSRLRRGATAITAALGFVIRDVEVSGRHATTAEEVLQAIDAARGAPILAVSPADARRRLQALPWVGSATVERRLPDTIVVRLTERHPMALWQNDHRMALIDTQGVVITSDNLGDYANLLLVVGDDAPAHTQALIDVLAAEPDLQAQVVSAVRVGGRRWNLQLRDGVTIELPELDVADAWHRLAEIERSHSLLARDIEKVDLRLGDRVTVTPSVPVKAPPPAKPAHAPAKPT